MTDEVNAGYGGKAIGLFKDDAIFEGFGLKHGLENFKSSAIGSAVEIGGLEEHDSFSKI